MLIDDKQAALRLAGRPEFILRVEEFLAAYNPKGLPALLVQARPALGVRHPLDVEDADVQRRFLAGAGGQAAWWESFRAMSRAKPTFHGIASLPNWEAPAWACEAHRDAHFVAGVWRF